mmetsp:Transcript_8092/g.15906  ORF Transcript_8092/g.15906 Transcript_8092/m.15906 type:complete len:122 (+) Transcript_8092:48-413(+)
MPLRIETNDFKSLFEEHALQDSASYKKELYKLQFSLLNKSLELLQTLADCPLSAPEKLADYEQLVLNFYQLIYALRPKQALYWIKTQIEDQIRDKEAVAKRLTEALNVTSAALEDCSKTEP